VILELNILILCIGKCPVFLKKIFLFIFVLLIYSSLYSKLDSNLNVALCEDSILCKKVCKECPLLGAYPRELSWIVNEIKNNSILDNRLLLYGAPGNGKTLIAQTMAYLTDSEFHYVNTASLVHYVGDGAVAIKDEFNKAIDLCVGSSKKKVIIFFDEINTIAANTYQQGRSEHKSTLTELWTHLDKFKDNSKIFIICATNSLDGFDPAFLSRFSSVIKIVSPDEKGRKELLEHYAQKFNIKLSLEDIEKVVKNSEGSSRRSLEGFIKYLARWASNDNENNVTDIMIETSLVKLRKMTKKERRFIKDEKKEKKMRELQYYNLERQLKNQNVDIKEKKIKQKEEAFLSKCIHEEMSKGALSRMLSERIMEHCMLESKRIREIERLKKQNQKAN
jgi:SpoVK/Ycf46/Vps4 family AAA+-type ATPase